MPNTQTKKNSQCPMPYASRAERPRPLPASLLSSSSWQSLHPLVPALYPYPKWTKWKEYAFTLHTCRMLAISATTYNIHGWANHCSPTWNIAFLRKEKYHQYPRLIETGVIYQSSSWQSTPHPSKLWNVETNSCSFLFYTFFCFFTNIRWHFF